MNKQHLDTLIRAGLFRAACLPEGSPERARIEEALKHLEDRLESEYEQKAA